MSSANPKSIILLSGPVGAGRTTASNRTQSTTVMAMPPPSPSVFEAASNRGSSARKISNEAAYQQNAVMVGAKKLGAPTM